MIRRQLRLGKEDVEFARRGTSVGVHNVFGDLPVRAKQLSLRYSYPTEVDKAFKWMRSNIVGYLLAQTTGVDLRFSVRSQRDCNFHCHAAAWGDGHFSVEAVVSTLFQAKLLANPETASWKSASVRTSDLAIRAAISIQPSPSKTNQFISIGHVPIPRNKGSNWLYELINDLFDSSSFGMWSNGPHSAGISGTREALSDASKTGKAVDRWPMFYFRIDTKSDKVLRMLDQNYQAGSVPRLTKALRSLTSHFLQSSGFAADIKAERTLSLEPCSSGGDRLPNKEVSSQPPRPGRLKKPVDGCSLNQWHRVKVGHHLNENFRYGLSVEGCDETSELPQQPLVDNVDDGDKIDASNPDDPRDMVSALGHEELGGNKVSGNNTLIAWTNPQNGRTVRLDPRTGAIVSNVTNYFIRPADPTQTGLRDCMLINSSGECEDNARSAPPKLQKYKNPQSFEPPEKPIQSLSSDEILALHTARNGFDPTIVSDYSLQNVTKEALSRARIMGQLDHKFVLATVLAPHRVSGLGEEELLIVVDQHAADERIKFEVLCQELCQYNSTTLDRPLVVEVDKVEASLFEHHREYFRRWCFDYRVRQSLPKAGEGPSWTIVVPSLPTVIAERCRAEPKLLVDLLRGQVWSDRSRGQLPQEEDAKNSWSSQIADCPTGLLEMLKSRSCRSAIMFNDHLDRRQCRNLVQTLSRCALPFQCAHGRPTVTVLAKVGGVGQGPASTSSREDTFCEAWNTWCGSS